MLDELAFYLIHAHFSTKKLIGSFNDNPGFQKTRDVIRLMAIILRSLWGKGEAEVAKHYLLALDTADLNDANVASRSVEIRKSLQDAMQTDIAKYDLTHDQPRPKLQKPDSR